MLIGGDDIRNDVITLGTCFTFAYIRASFLTAQSTESNRGTGDGIRIPEM